MSDYEIERVTHNLLSDYESRVSEYLQEIYPSELAGAEIAEFQKQVKTHRKAIAAAIRADMARLTEANARLKKANQEWSDDTKAQQERAGDYYDYWMDEARKVKERTITRQKAPFLYAALDRLLAQHGTVIRRSRSGTEYEFLGLRFVVEDGKNPIFALTWAITRQDK
jgi:hypothetical protein